MLDRLTFIINRLKERLWLKPLLMCLLSITGIVLAKGVGRFAIFDHAPQVTIDSIETLLTTLSASMLVIATFAVGSMVSSYASASTSATPRTFPLVIADDVSQNALSIFIGAFIFSVVATIAIKNSYYDPPGRFVLFAMTIMVFVLVVLTFVRWVDRIARLGRLGSTIDKVEEKTSSVLRTRRLSPTLRCMPMRPPREGGVHVFSSKVGYVQRVDVDILQEVAKRFKLQITVEALPGAFAAPGRALAYATLDAGGEMEIDVKAIEQAFIVDHDRTFDADPRFGLVVLSEIGSRALSPAVNDPGTAIDIIGTLVRMLAQWVVPLSESEKVEPEYDRVFVPAIALGDMFDDAFTGIARDGAGLVEVAIRLQKALHSLATIEHEGMRAAAKCHARLALARAEKALVLEADFEAVRALAAFAAE